MNETGPTGVVVLLVEDNPGDARLVETTLAAIPDMTFTVEWFDRLEPALARLEAGGVDVVLMDLSLPDAHGMENVARAVTAAPHVPVVVLTGSYAESAAAGALGRGAQDYLQKDRATPDVVERAIRYAIERHRMAAQLHHLAVVDELTGLHNRRGLMALGEQELKRAKRAGYTVTVMLFDLDGMKRINDGFGHAEGDQALRDTAEILRAAFRSTDVVARIGGDEFCVLLSEGHAEVQEMIARVDEVAARHNATKGRPYSVQLSIGAGAALEGEEVTVDVLIERADREMYAQKEERQGRRRVLVVDDDEALRHLAELMLQDHYDVSLAATGLQALEKADADRPDIIVLDRMLPDIAGTEVATRLRAGRRTRLIPIIMLTAVGDSLSEVEGLRAGVDDYVAKPVDESVLRARIENLLARVKRR